MAGPRRRRRAPTSIYTTPDPAKIGPLLRKAGFVGTEEDPVTCRARYDHDGTPRSVKARYAGGWCCRMTIHKNGTFSLTQSISVTVRGAPKVG